MRTRAGCVSRRSLLQPAGAGAASAAARRRGWRGRSDRGGAEALHLHSVFPGPLGPSAVAFRGSSGPWRPSGESQTGCVLCFACGDQQGGKRNRNKYSPYLKVVLSAGGYIPPFTEECRDVLKTCSLGHARRTSVPHGPRARLGESPRTAGRECRALPRPRPPPPHVPSRRDARGPSG